MKEYYLTPLYKETQNQTHNKTQQNYSAWIFVYFYVLGTAMQVPLF